MDLITTIARLGGLASRTQLAQLGLSRRKVDGALRDRWLRPVRPGWVALPSANRVAVMAVLGGGRLTGATALRSYGVWAGIDLRVHLQIPPRGHCRTRESDTPLTEFADPQRAYGEVVISWADVQEQPPAAIAWRVSVADALTRFAKRESDEQIVAAFESAVHEKRMSRSAAAALLGRLPRRVRRLLVRMNFLAESGLESIGRFRLENLGFCFQQQVQIGPDRVDLVIDGWLVIEFDGDEWHDPMADRRRTNRLIRAGYRVLRFGYHDVIEGWDVTLATIHEMVSGGSRQPALASGMW